jgi:3-oxoacyl-[acyl-carrier-protein] synthase II
MGRVSYLATRTSELALEQAQLLNSESLKNGEMGISFGSTYGSPPAFVDFLTQASVNRSLDGINGSTYIKFMSHTAAANLAQFFEIKGRLVSTVCACTAGSQGIGYAYENVQMGKQKMMLGGGAEELHYLSAAAFDILFATSTQNQNPTSVPRPFDQSRDGLVVGEGSATLVLETLESARARNAPILAEIIGFATNCDGEHMVHPSVEGMQSVMEQALRDAGISPDLVDCVNMHGTSTEIGDINESLATWNTFGRNIPVYSLKGAMGHTLGACGAIEAWIGIHSMNEGWIPYTLNLKNVDERCAPLDYVREVRTTEVNIFMSNNFAFGGVNTSLIFKKWTE